MACHRCDECQGQDHHWLPACPDPEEEYDRDTECLARWECKHCDATLPYDPDSDDGFPRG